MRTYIALLATLWFILGTAPCRADVTEYDIEIAIFEDLSERYLDSEKWPRIEHAIPPQENITDQVVEELLEPASAEYPDNNDVINIASNNSTMLDAHVKKLEASSRYKVLVHKSWRQTGLDAKSAIDIAIDSNKENKTGSSRIMGIAAEMPGSTQDPDDELSSSISGTVKITLGRYLHIYTDLIYKKPSSRAPLPVSLEDNRFSEFLIKSHRRMRSRELHYLDHPLVGMLVMALPVEPVETDNKQQTDRQ